MGVYKTGSEVTRGTGDDGENTVYVQHRRKVVIGAIRGGGPVDMTTIIVMNVYEQQVLY